MYRTLMIWLGFLFTLGIPVASFFFTLVMSLAGGYKIPLAWIFSYYSALGITFLSVFVFLTFNRARNNWRIKTRIVILSTLISIYLGIVVGLALAESGVLGHSWEDPLRGGSSTLKDAVFYAFTGTFAGLGLGLGNVARMQYLEEAVGLRIALIRCLSTAAGSVGIALVFALLL